MATSQAHPNRTRFISSKKGIVGFIFSKLAFLIFGIIISGAFFYFLFIQQNMQELNKLVTDADSIANVIGSASASPFNLSFDYNTKISGTLSFENQSFILTSGKTSLRHALLFPINNTNNLTFDDCLHIEKIKDVVVSSCQ